MSEVIWNYHKDMETSRNWEVKKNLNQEKYKWRESETYILQEAKMKQFKNREILFVSD